MGWLYGGRNSRNGVEFNVWSDWQSTIASSLLGNNKKALVYHKGPDTPTNVQPEKYVNVIRGIAYPDGSTSISVYEIPAGSSSYSPIPGAVKKILSVDEVNSLVGEQLGVANDGSLILMGALIPANEIQNAVHMSVNITQVAGVNNGNEQVMDAFCTVVCILIIAILISSCTLFITNWLSAGQQTTQDEIRLKDDALKLAAEQTKIQQEYDTPDPCSPNPPTAKGQCFHFILFNSGRLVRFDKFDGSFTVMQEGSVLPDTDLETAIDWDKIITYSIIGAIAIAGIYVISLAIRKKGVDKND